MRKISFLFCSAVLAGMLLTGCASSDSDSSVQSQEEPAVESTEETAQDTETIQETATPFTKEELEDNVKILYNAVSSAAIDLENAGHPLPEHGTFILKENTYYIDNTEKGLLNVNDLRETVRNYLDVSPEELTSLEERTDNYLIITEDSEILEVMLLADDVLAAYPTEIVEEMEEYEQFLSLLRTPEQYVPAVIEGYSSRARQAELNSNAKTIYNAAATVTIEMDMEGLPLVSAIITKEEIYYFNPSDEGKLNHADFIKRMQYYYENITDFDDFIIVLEEGAVKATYAFSGDTEGSYPTAVTPETNSTFDEVLESLKAEN